MSQHRKVGLVGYGFHGQTIHKAIEQTPCMEMVALLEPDSSKHQFLEKSARAYVDLQEFMRHPGLDGVIIASPVNTHRHIVETAVQAGVTAIELEKPMAITYADASKIARIAREAGVKLMVGMTTHYRPEMLLAERFLREGSIGEIRTIREEMVIGISPFPMNYVAEENEGGVLLENGIHMLDHLIWFGGKVQELLGASVSKCFLGGFHEDAVMFQLLHESGIISQGHLQWMPYKEAHGFCLKLYGTRGCIEVRGLDSVRINSDGVERWYPCYDMRGTDYIDEFASRHLPGVVGQLADFLAFLNGENESKVPLDHVLSAHFWVDQIYGRRP